MWHTDIYRCVLNVAKPDYCHVRSSVCINATPTGRIFVIFITGNRHEHLPRKHKFCYNRAKISCTLHEELSTYRCCRRQ